MANVLVVDDDLLMRWSLERILSRDGHVVHTADSAAAAVETARRADHRVVITDYEMPDGNGLDLLRWIKQHIPEAQVILITAFPTPELERQARDMGAFDVLEKPFPVAALKRLVGDAIATPGQ
jgi:two-component system response regulator PilR (NtrC family)